MQNAKKTAILLHLFPLTKHKHILRPTSTEIIEQQTTTIIKTFFLSKFGRPYMKVKSNRSIRKPKQREIKKSRLRFQHMDRWFSCDPVDDCKFIGIL
jgi:hypothetical protein